MNFNNLFFSLLLFISSIGPNCGLVSHQVKIKQSDPAFKPDSEPQSGAREETAEHDYKQPDTILLTYKRVDTTELKMKVFKPASYQSDKQYPAIIFFFGGGWQRGSMAQFEPQARYFASRGMVAVVTDYRVATRHHTTPFEAVADAKSAIRYLRIHAKELSIDPNRIVASGGSSGGHLAASADLTDLDEPGEDLSVSSRPNALVLFNPVLDTSPEGYGYHRVGERYKEISPYHKIRAQAAPGIAFLGTKDEVISVATANKYRDKMISAGNRFELRLYEDQIHGFYRTGHFQKETLREADLFLQSLEYIEAKTGLNY